MSSKAIVISGFNSQKHKACSIFRKILEHTLILIFNYNFNSMTELSQLCLPWFNSISSANKLHFRKDKQFSKHFQLDLFY